MLLLDIDKLSFTYKNAASAAIKEISFSLSGGEILLLCGPTGCGKSTLLRCIGERGESTDGKIEYYGERIGYVGQFSHVFATDRVESELAFASENAKNPPSETARRVAELAAALGLERMLEREVFGLSGGERRLVSLGAALSGAPELLLLDEPAASLDPVTAARFYDALFRLARETGTALIISEHKTEQIIDRVDRVLMMKNGQIAALDAPKRLFSALNDPELCRFLPLAARAFGKDKKTDGLPLTVSEGRAVLFERVGKKKLTAEAAIPKKAHGTGELALSLRGVGFSYAKNTHDVLCELDLSLKKGEALCLLGANGSGKSTLLSVAAGLKKCSYGKITVLGKKIQSYKDNSLYSGTLSLLPQDVRMLFVRDTVKEELEGADTELFPFDLSPLYDRHPYELSGGEARMVGLAIALMSKPKILLLDEPTGGLDPLHTRMLGEALNKLKQNGMSILAVTHDADFAPLFADRCALLSHGSVAAEGDTREFLSQGVFFTTSARKLSRGILGGAVTEDDILRLIE